MRVVTATLTAMLLLSACGREEAASNRAWLEDERARLDAEFDRLEARLLDGRARVRQWEDLRARHAGVTAVACEVNGRHVADMARVELEERRYAAGRASSRLAAAPALGGRGGGVTLATSTTAAPPPAQPPSAIPGAGGD